MFYAHKTQTAEGLPKVTLTIVGTTSLEQFVRTLDRSLNTDEAAIVSLRQLSDLLNHGKVLQDYTQWCNKPTEEAIASERDYEVEAQIAARHAPAPQPPTYVDQHDRSVQDVAIVPTTPSVF